MTMDLGYSAEGLFFDLSRLCRQQWSSIRHSLCSGPPAAAEHFHNCHLETPTRVLGDATDSSIVVLWVLVNNFLYEMLPIA